MSETKTDKVSVLDKRNNVFLILATVFILLSCISSCYVEIVGNGITFILMMVGCMLGGVCIGISMSVHDLGRSNIE